MFPDRNSALPGKMSELVQEIKAAGYHSLDQLQSHLEAGSKRVADYEKKYKEGKLFFADIGAARYALEAISDNFAEIRKQENEKKRKPMRRAKAR